MAIQKIHHYKITVGDMDRSLRFYRDLLGFKVLQDVERSNLPSYDKIMGYSDVRLRVAMIQHEPSGALFGLIQYRNPAPKTREQAGYYVASSALSIQVDDIDAEYRRLKAAGVPFRSEPVDIVRDGKKVARANYMADPDGFAIELYQPV